MEPFKLVWASGQFLLRKMDCSTCAVWLSKLLLLLNDFQVKLDCTVGVVDAICIGNHMRPRTIKD